MGLRCCRRVSNPAGPFQPYLSAVLGTNEVNTSRWHRRTAPWRPAASGPVPARVPRHRCTRHRAVVRDAQPATGPRSTDRVRRRTSILNEAVLYGTGTAANIGRPQIGKTGTAMDHNDAWFVGAVPQMAAAVWVGFPEGQVRMEPPRTRITVFGGTWPAQIWRLLMLEADRRPAGDGRSRNREVGFVSVSVDASQEPNCLPNPFTLPQNIETLQFIEGRSPRRCARRRRRPGGLVPSTIGSRSRRDRGPDPGRVLRRGGRASTQPKGTVVAQVPSAGTEAFQRARTTTVVIVPVSKRKGGGQN